MRCGSIVWKQEYCATFERGLPDALRVSFWLLEKIIAGWDLGVGVIVSEFNGMRDFTGRRIVASGLPAKAVPNGLSNRARFLALLRQILVVRCRARQAGPPQGKKLPYLLEN